LVSRLVSHLFSSATYKPMHMVAWIMAFTDRSMPPGYDVNVAQ
jgi:hypothetical protein